MPALPLDEAGKYVAGAYVVFLTLIIIYIAILGAKISRVEREVTELLEDLEEPSAKEPGRSPGVQAEPEAEQPPQGVGQDAPQELTPTRDAAEKRPR